MKHCLNIALAAAFAGILSGGAAFAAPTIGQPAPAFSVQDSQGHTQALAGQKGKYVVLEWFNFSCPFTRKHYDSGNMQKLQKTYEAKGVVWYSVLSSGPGKNGYATAEQADKEMRDHQGTPTAILLDPKGVLAHLYDAKTTPDMYVIGPTGLLLYQGAIDNRPSADPNDIPRSINYVSKALDEAMAGKPVSTPATAPYGCAVKY